MTAYIALLRKDPTSDYGVEFPDFPGCVTAGTTLDDARRMANEALTLHIDGLLADGDPLPTPTSLDTIMSHPDAAETVAFLVNVPASPARAVRINITLPNDLLAAIDATTKNRSRFLAKAARASLCSKL